MKKLLHTPEGVRDIYNVECGKKLALEGRLKKVFHMYGYHDIQTPTFEYFDVSRKEIGTISSRELYKFFDKDGNTLVLRPDFTPVHRPCGSHLVSGGDTADPLMLYRQHLCESFQLSGTLKGDHAEGESFWAMILRRPMQRCLRWSSNLC